MAGKVVDPIDMVKKVAQHDKESAWPMLVSAGKAALKSEDTDALATLVMQVQADYAKRFSEFAEQLGVATKWLLEQYLTTTEEETLRECETVIERGLKTFYEVGTALLTIRDNRLYRVEYRTFEDYCRKRWQMDRHYAHRVIDAAQVAENLLPMGNIPDNERQARPLTELEPDEQRIVWTVVQDTAPAGKVTAVHVKSVVNVFKEILITNAVDDGTGEQIKVSDIVNAAITEETYERMMRQKTHITEALEKKNGVPPALQSSESNEWYTPKNYLEAARSLMGAIDLDPASNAYANQTVQAAKFYTLDDNGLKQNWKGRVWLNPPYGRDDGESNQGVWSARLLEAFISGSVTEAVLLVNAVTDRQWFKPLWDHTICFTDHRIRFYNEHGEFGSPTHGNALVYLGAQQERFIEHFKQFGPIVKQIG